MPRLPTPGGDNGNWGDILNEYLQVGHNADGSFKNGSIGRGNLSDALKDELDAKLENITGHVAAGSNVTLAGQGTLASPYQISAVNSGGDITGPDSSTINAVPRFSSTNGKALESSGVTISDTDGTKVGIETTAPTHSLTLPSTTTGIAIYNTADQTTNFERATHSWSGNTYTITTAFGGTGTSRPITVNSPGNTAYLIGNNTVVAAGVNIGSSSSSAVLIQRNATTADLLELHSTGLTRTTGVQYAFRINPVVSQSSTAGYTMLLINPTESTTGSGAKLLADFQVGGSSKFRISNTGIVTMASQKITGLANGTAATDAATFGQIPVAGSGITNTAGTWSVSTGGATTVTTVSASTYTFSATNGVWKGTLQASCTFSLPAVSSGGAEQIISALFIQDATGGRAVTLPNGSSAVTCLWASGIAPTLPTTPGSISKIVFQNIDGQWFGMLAGINYA